MAPALPGVPAKDSRITPAPAATAQGGGRVAAASVLLRPAGFVRDRFRRWWQPRPAPAGSSWAIGTELNLVRRLAAANPDKKVHYLDSTVCFCSTMNRIDLPHLTWAMESLAAGRVVNRIVVDADDAHWARVALDQMLALPGY